MTTHHLSRDIDRDRRITPSMIEEVRNHIQQLLVAGIIRRSESPWTSNVVLVMKKSGELRMCVDYRQLNARTISMGVGTGGTGGTCPPPPIILPSEIFLT